MIQAVTRAVTRVLVLGEHRVVIPDEAVVAIEAVEAEVSEPAPWLLDLLSEGLVSSRPADRRALRLVGGGRVEVPAEMRIDEVEVLALPPLLRVLAESRGVVGITELADGLGVVCDPRLLPHSQQPKPELEPDPKEAPP